MTTTPSTTIVSNLRSLTSSTSNTLRSAGAAGMDVAGMLPLALSKANELKACLTLIVRAVDAADGNLQTLDNILASLT